MPYVHDRENFPPDLQILSVLYCSYQQVTLSLS